MSVDNRPESTALVKVEDYSLDVTPEQKQAYEARYKRLAPQLVAHAERSLLREDARDAVQAAMAGIWARWNKLAPMEPGDPFFYQAVNNQIDLTRRRQYFDRLRLRRFFHHVTQWPRRAPPADAELYLKEIDAIADEALADMPERCSQVWSLVREHELTYQQAAESLGLEVATTKRHMTRAQGRLRERLVDAGYGEAAAQLPRKAVTKLLPTKAAGDDVHD